MIFPTPSHKYLDGRFQRAHRSLMDNDLVQLLKDFGLNEANTEKALAELKPLFPDVPPKLKEWTTKAHCETMGRVVAAYGIITRWKLHQKYSGEFPIKAA